MGSTAQHSYLKQKLNRALVQQGWQVQSNPGSARTGSGTSDLTACCAGRFVALEVKTGGGQLSPTQRVYLQRVQRAGGLALVARQVAPVVYAITRFIQEGQNMADQDFELDFDDLFDDAPTDLSSVAIVQEAEDVIKHGRVMPEPVVPRAPASGKSKPPVAEPAEPINPTLAPVIERLDRIEAMVKDARSVIHRLSSSLSTEAGDTVPPRPEEDPENLLDVFEPEDEPAPLEKKPRGRGRPRKS